ncbi:MAG: hypothetical protein ACRDJ9_09735, partial [Dehalococcoidia bacterium]
MQPTKRDPGSGDYPHGDYSHVHDYEYRDVPGGPPKPGEPGYVPESDTSPYAASIPVAPGAPEALKAYRDALTYTVDEEGKFLAKMWAMAKHMNRHHEFEELLGTGMKLRPDKVENSAEVMKSLAGVYEALSDEARKAWGNMEPGWKGLAAEDFENYFTRLNGQIKGEGEERSLYFIALNTGRVLFDFSEALGTWRKDLAKAISEVSKEDERIQHELRAAAYDVVLEDKVEIAKKVLEAMLAIWSAIHKAGKENQETLRRFAEKLDI